MLLGRIGTTIPMDLETVLAQVPSTGMALSFRLRRVLSMQINSASMGKVVLGLRVESSFGWDITIGKISLKSRNMLTHIRPRIPENETIPRFV